jgi:hypothetical protein
MNIEMPADLSRTLSMAATASMAPIKLWKARLFSAVLRWTNSAAATGTISAAVSNDGVNFVPYTGGTFSSQPAAAAAAIYYELPNGGSCAFRWLQFTYTRVSGGATDTLTADLAAKG